MIAQGFVTNGAKVYLAGRDAKALEQAAQDLSPSSSSSSSLSLHAPIPIPANLQHLEACESLVKRITELEPSGIHILVNNAGATWGADLDNYPDSAWTKLLTLNLQRVFTLTQLCLPLLEKAATQEDPGRIINIGSIDGLRVPSMGTFAYSASKAGLHHLSRHLAVQLGSRNITSNVLACGPFETKMMKATLDSFGESIRNNSPVGRIGAPEDVAGASLFLASKAGYVTFFIRLHTDFLLCIPNAVFYAWSTELLLR